MLCCALLTLLALPMLLFSSLRRKLHRVSVSAQYVACAYLGRASVESKRASETVRQQQQQPHLLPRAMTWLHANSIWRKFQLFWSIIIFFLALSTCSSRLILRYFFLSKNNTNATFLPRTHFSPSNKSNNNNNNNNNINIEFLYPVVNAQYCSRGGKGGATRLSRWTSTFQPYFSKLHCNYIS